MEFQFIRTVIQNCLDKGYEKFVIYPLSESGIRIKECLRECFDIEPIAIVDNGLAKYNNRLITGIELKDVVTDKTCILVSTKYNGIVEEIREELSEYCKPEQIVLMDRLHNDYIGNMHAFKFDNFIPAEYYINEKYRDVDEYGKIKIRFLHVSHTSWNAIKTVYESFEQDKRFSSLIILTGSRERISKEVAQMERFGCRYVTCYNYNPDMDKPDIVVMNHPWDMSYTISDLRKYSKYIIAASTTLISYGADDKDPDDIFMGAFSFHKPDVYIFDTLVYKKLMSAGKYPYKIVEMGNPKYDGIYNACRKKQYPVGWEKFRNKKVILYTTDHGVPNRIHDDISFDLYAKEIFEYFSQHKEMGLIFRPHQTFVSDMLEAGIWTKEELEKAKEFFRNTENIIWDDTDSYDVAYSISDGILSDAHCGILVSALPTLKPIAVLNRYDRNVPVFEGEIVKNYYQINSKEDLVVFFEMIANENDPMKEQRVICAKENVKNFDGKNGERIYQFIVDSYLREYLDN